MNYFNILADDFSLDSINNKMLLKSNIIDFNNRGNSNFMENILQKKIRTNIEPDYMRNNNKNDTKNDNKKDNRKDKNIFYPKEKDTLFWCYYINKNGIDEFLNNKRHNFTIEHDIKINTIEKIQSMKDILKINKIKKTLVEDELMNQNKIGIAALKTLMLIDNTNLIIVKKYCYQKIIFNKDKEDINTDNYKIIVNDANNYYVYTKLSDKELVNMIDTRYSVEDIIKPLKSISSYKLPEIQSISERLDIKLININGKNKTKQNLYTEILEKIVA